MAAATIGAWNLAREDDGGEIGKTEGEVERGREKSMVPIRLSSFEKQLVG